jgi:hypothetical protein
MDKINGEIAFVDKNTLEQYFHLSYGTMPKLMSGMILHVVPRIAPLPVNATPQMMEEFERERYKQISSQFDMRIASPYLSRRLLRHWRSHARFSARVFLDASFGAGLKGGLRGYILEEAAHASVCDGGMFKLASLNFNGAAGASRDINWPKIQHEVEFDTREMTDLVSLAPSVYARPTQSNFPAVDSFWVMTGTLFGITGWVLVASQMTVAKKHPVIADWLRKIRNHSIGLLQKLPDKTIAQQVAANPMVLAFIVDKDVQVNQAQDLVTGGKNSHVYQAALGFNVVQFRLQLDSVFEEVSKKVKE